MGKSVSQIGRYKQNIHSALFKNENLLNVLVNGADGMSLNKRMNEFQKYVQSHLFIDDTIEKENDFIFYDVRISYMRSQIKTCTILMYIITPRDQIDVVPDIEGYYGNRTDILAQLVEDTLINDEKIVREFGIGDLELENVDIYNATRFYGRILTFKTKDFR